MKTRSKDGKGGFELLEIKNFRDLSDTELSIVKISRQTYDELIDFKVKGKELYGMFCDIVYRRYIENFACFGNGGSITYEELAELLQIDLPKVPYVGMDRYLEIAGKAREYGKEEQ